MHQNFSKQVNSNFLFNFLQLLFCGTNFYLEYNINIIHTKSFSDVSSNLTKIAPEVRQAFLLQESASHHFVELRPTRKMMPDLSRSRWWSQTWNLRIHIFHHFLQHVIKMQCLRPATLKYPSIILQLSKFQCFTWFSTGTCSWYQFSFGIQHQFNPYKISFRCQLKFDQNRTGGPPKIFVTRECFAPLFLASWNYALRVTLEYSPASRFIWFAASAERKCQITTPGMAGDALSRHFFWFLTF